MKTTSPSAATLVGVYLALMALLALTAAAPFFTSVNWASAVSLVVALAKGSLIALFFMRVLYERPRTRVVAMAAIAWLVFFFVLTFGDYLTRGMGGILGK